MAYASIEMPLERPFWREFSPLQLTFLMGVYARSVATMERRHAYGQYTDDTIGVISDLHYQLHEIQETLAAKLWESEDDPTYVDRTAAIMGSYPDYRAERDTQ